MNNMQIFHKAAAVMIGLVIIISNAMAGDAVINGPMTNAGTFIIKGTLAGTVKNIGGTVEFGKNGDHWRGWYSFNRCRGICRRL